MDLGLSAKTLAWIRVAGVTLGSFQAAYSGFVSDEWISSTEWVSLAVITAISFVGAVSGAPKDARDAGSHTRSSDPNIIVDP